jgi:galactokinase
MTITELKEAFQFIFNKNVEAAYFKPEKFSLIGDNIKSLYQTTDAFVLSHGIYLLIAKNDEERYGFWSFSQHRPKYFEKKQLNRNKEQSWIKFALNIYAQLVNQGVDIPCGFDMLVWGNLSVTEEVGNHIEALATCALSEQLNLNYNSDQAEIQPKLDSGYKLLISNTHTPHKVSNSPLATLIKENSKLIENYLPLENELTQNALKAIEQQNVAELGKLLTQNHILLREQLKIVPPEIELIIAEAEKTDGVLGMRMTGCGFGGNTITLIKESSIPAFVEQINEIYEFETDVQNFFFTANIGDDIFKLYNLQ